MTTKDDEATTRAKREEDDRRKAADKGSAKRSGAGTRSTGDDEERAPASITEFDYDPMEDPTFNKNEAQQYAEPGHAGSAEANEANEEVN